HRPAGGPLGEAVLRLSRSSRTARTEPEPYRLAGLPGVARGQRRSAAAGTDHPASARGGRISVGRTRRPRGPRHADRPAWGLVDLEHDVVEVAIHPVLSWLERLDDRMTGRTEVLGRMLILRRVAAPDVTAHLAKPKVHPGVPHLQTFLAAFR